MLIKAYKERIERRTLRHQQVLTFLRDETWSSAAVIREVMQCSPTQVTKTMQQLAKLRLVARHYVEESSMAIWGITPHGLAHAWINVDEMEARPHCEPSRMSALAVPHHLDVQLARLRAERAGWSDWKRDALLPKGMAKRPDAIATDQQGNMVAVEVERHIKTLKRYESVLAAYLQAMRRGELSMVHYVTPSSALAERLKRVLGLVQAVPVMGQRVPLTDKHRSRFVITSLTEWPPKL